MKEFVEKLIEQLEELQEKYKGIRANTHCVVTETSECDSCKADNYLYARLKCIDEVIKIVNKLGKEYKCSQICSGRMLYQCGYEDGQKSGLQQGYDMIKKLLKEQQSKMDKLLVHEGEEVI